MGAQEDNEKKDGTGSQVEPIVMKIVEFWNNAPLRTRRRVPFNRILAFNLDWIELSEFEQNSVRLCFRDEVDD